MNGNSRTFVVLACFLWLFCGCDDSPSFEATNNNRVINQPRSWTSENGRGGYEWKLNQQGQFTIPIPPMFPFLSELASQPKQTTLWPGKSANREPWHRPEWMSDEVHEIFQRFTEPASKKVLLQLPAKQISHTLAFDLSRNGETLVTLNDGKIELYDLSLSSPPQSFLCPLKDAYGILTTSSKSKFYLCNSKSIALIELADAKILGKVECRFPVNHWEKASGSDTLLAVTTDNVISVFDSELKSSDQCVSFEDASTLSASLDPAGEYVLAVGPYNFVYWTPLNADSALRIAGDVPGGNSVQSMPQTSYVIAGKPFDCLWNSSSLRLISRVSDQDRRNFGNGQFVSHNLNDLRIRSFGIGDIDSYLICGKQNTMESKASEYLIFDFAMPIAGSYLGKNGRFRHSEPTSIGFEPIKRLITDRSGHTLVTFGQSGLSVLKRTPWIGPPDANLCYELAKTLLASGDFDQLERCAKELRQQDWPEHGLWGEQVYTCFVQQVGRVTSEAKLESAKQERLTSWHQSGSDLALLSRAFDLEIVVYWKSSLAQREYDGSPQMTTNIFKSLNSFESQLDMVLERPHPPALAFCLKYCFIQLRAKSISETESILKRCVELYPNQLDIHKRAVVRMLSGSNQNLLPTQAYIKAIANSFSKELVDEATVLMMSELSPEQWRLVFASDAWLKEQEQVERTVTKWIRDNEKNKIEAFLQGQPELKTSLRKTGIDQYYETTFPLGL